MNSISNGTEIILDQRYDMPRQKYNPIEYFLTRRTSTEQSILIRIARRHNGQRGEAISVFNKLLLQFLDSLLRDFIVEVQQNQLPAPIRLRQIIQKPEKTCLRLQHRNPSQVQRSHDKLGAFVGPQERID